MVMMKKQELRRLVENMEPNQVLEHLSEALRNKDLKPHDFSIRDLFEATVSGGRELLETIVPESGGLVRLQEAGAVDTSLFNNITGQIVYTTVLGAYEQPAFIGDKICRTIPTRFNGEKIPGITQIGDQADQVNEGDEYPRAGVSEDWVDTPQTARHGMIVEITKETLLFDQTGMILERCNKVGEWLGVKKEKSIIDLALGVTNNWKPQSTATNTYSNSSGLHNFDNQVNSNGLENYTDINAAQQALEAITDPWTGEPVIITATQLLCSGALAYTARSIINATQVKIDPNANSGTAQVVNYIPPAALIGQNIEIVTNPWVLSRMTAGSVTNTNWYFGDFRKAFAYMQNWPVTVVQAPANNEAEFTRDIVTRFKASERGVAAVIDPRYVVLNAVS